MKFFFTPPTTEDGQQFYTRYASLIPKLKLPGYLAQIVSGLTEWGILYALIYSSLAVFWPDHAAAAGAVGATVGVAIIEGGLRGLIPFSARAIIKKRWKGLDGWISAIVLSLTALLLAGSAWLSFAGSRSLVESVATPPAEATTTLSDSLATSESYLVNTAWQSDVDAIRDAYEVRLDAVRMAAAATIRRLDGQLAKLKTKERTSGQKFTTARAEVRQQITDAEADRDTELATLATAREAELATLRTSYRSRLDGITAGRDDTRQQVATTNASALADHQAKVGQYGGGLAWFTVLCLLVLIVSITVEELHRAGAGIEEQAEPDAYTFEGGAVGAFREALAARSRRFVFGLVHHIERGTPEAPEPVAAPIIWQRPGQLKVANSVEGVRRKLKPLRPMKGTDAPLPDERRLAGFNRTHQSNQDNQSNQSNTKTPLTQSTQLHTDESGPESTQEATSGPSRGFVESRLKMYRQRLGNAKQRAAQQQRKRGKVNPKTAGAIENNQHHVEHYAALLKSLTDEK